MANKTIFTRIIEREVPAYIIAEDKHHIAFLDIEPVAKGHALVVPKRVEDYLFDLHDQELAMLISFTKQVAKAIQKVIPCIRIGVKVHGLEVPHVHVHLIPILQQEDFEKQAPKPSISPQEMENTAAHIRKAMNPLHGS